MQYLSFQLSINPFTHPLPFYHSAMPSSLQGPCSTTFRWMQAIHVHDLSIIHWWLIQYVHNFAHKPLMINITCLWLVHNPLMIDTNISTILSMVHKPLMINPAYPWNIHHLIDGSPSYPHICPSSLMIFWEYVSIFINESYSMGCVIMLIMLCLSIINAKTCNGEAVPSTWRNCGGWS
jgi:hypothetical protein